MCVSPEIQVRQLFVSKMAVTVSILSPLLLGTLIRRRQFKDIQTFLSFFTSANLTRFAKITEKIKDRQQITQKSHIVCSTIKVVSSSFIKNLVVCGYDSNTIEV